MDELFKNEIPPWDPDKLLLLDEDGEDWKRGPKLQRAKELYEQSREIYQLAKLFCETLVGDKVHIAKELIMENVLMIPPKIIGAEAGDMYVLRMENAAIIRLNAIQLQDQVRFAEMIGTAKTEYGKLLLIEIENFKRLFVNWVEAFEVDDSKDDWGVF